MSFKMQGKFDQTLAVWKEFLAQHPTHSAWSAVQREIYQLEPVRLAIDTPRAVYYRGEKIEGVIRAAYYYGAGTSSATVIAPAGRTSRPEAGGKARLLEGLQSANKAIQAEQQLQLQGVYDNAVQEGIGGGFGGGFF